MIKVKWLGLPAIKADRASFKLLSFSILVALFAGLLWFIAKPYFGVHYTYKLGDIAQENIVSTKDITYINARETEKRIHEAKMRVPPIFDLQVSKDETGIENLNQLFSLLDRQTETESINLEELYKQTALPLDFKEFKRFVSQYSEKGYREKLVSVITYIAQKGLSTFSRDELARYQSTGIILKKIWKAEITEEKTGIDQVIAADELSDAVTDYLRNTYADLNRSDVQLLNKITLVYIEPNLYFNADESNRFMNEELKKVEPVYNTIKKGAIVIRTGEEINEENLPKLNAISLYTSHLNLRAVTGIGVLLLVLLYISLLVFMEEGGGEDVRRFLIFSGFVFVAVFYAYLVTLIKNRPDNLILGVLIPTSGITMTAEVLYKRKFSFTLAMILPILFLLISGNDPYTFLFSLGSGLIALYAVKSAERRSDLLGSSLIVIATNELILFAVGLLRGLPTRGFVSLLIWGAGNGIVSVVMALGTTPFFEILLNLPTNFRLLELSDLNAPILKKMQIEAPGTYHHSINVANMAENAAKNIKANALLVRVAALYHDIGKIPNAEYYIENNQGISKHSFIKPSLSNSILKAHIKIGTDMAREIKLPKEVIDIIAQHHGTSLMKYFYHQALKGSRDGSEIDKKDYHYQGPKPQNREAAIVMLADTVEAASRTLKNPSAKRIDEIVNDIIESKFREGQLNESTLTLRGLMKISISFRRYLTGVYHSRIEYPDDKDIERSEIGQKQQ